MDAGFFVGKEYYINKKEYIGYMTKYSNALFCNVCYILKAEIAEKIQKSKKIIHCIFLDFGISS